MARLPTSDQFPPFEFRPGTGNFPGWGGVITEGDPGSNPPNRPRRVKNMRFEGGSMRTRPGLYQVLVLPDTLGMISHIGMYQNTGRNRRLWLSNFGCFGEACTTGATIYNYDPERLVNKIQTAGFFYGFADRVSPIGIYGDDLYFGDIGGLRRVDWPVLQPSDDLMVGPSVPNTLDYTIDLDTAYQITWLQEFDSKLFIGMENIATPANSKIMTWNGLTLRDDVTGIPKTTAACVLRNMLVVAQETGDSIRWRTTGGTGTWTAVSSGTGKFVGRFWERNTMVEFRDKVWIAGEPTDTLISPTKGALWSFNGTTLALEHAPVGADIVCVCRHKNRLFYAMNQLGAGTPPLGRSSLGRYDPDNTALTWVDDYKDLYAQHDKWAYVYCMVDFHDDIFIGMGGPKIICSTANDVQGTWISIGTTSPETITPKFAPILMVVF